MKRDFVFYRKKGGVTLSGGEPLHFGKFCIKLPELCAQDGIGIVFETCGYGDWEVLREYARFAQGIFFDIKHADTEKHRTGTGVDNHLILENFTRLTDEYERVVVRVPVIPNFNDTPEEMADIAACISKHLGKKITIC